MARFLLTFCLLVQIGILSAANHDYTVEGGSTLPYEYAASGFGVNNISVFILDGMTNAKITYKSFANVAGQHKWFRYKTDITADRQPVDATQEGSISWVTPEAGYGYYVEIENEALRYYIYIVDYNQYRPSFNSLWVEETEGVSYCEALWLAFDADVPEIRYYAPTGSYSAVTRAFAVEYKTLEWKDDALVEVVKSEPFEGNLVSSLNVPAPLMSTVFTLKIDPVSAHFGAPKTIVSDLYESIAAKGWTVEPEVTDSKDNPAKGSGTKEDRYTGSAPITALFSAYASEAVNVFDWKMYKEENYPGLEEAKKEGDEVEWVFRNLGDYVVELVVRNNFTCTDSTAQFHFKVTNSELIIPNAFSPGTTPGRNDIFKVKAHSIVKFEGAIFSRWGVKVFEWNSVNDGWDGKYKGKYVPAGVYYYIIRAEGSDGTKYNKQGDINILRPRTIDDKLPDEAEPGL